ncbi:MAG TPA: SEC-C metal-binding domain-containing protein [Gemmatimonadales bacterium]|nr:SEC-C metal-binding domain-containing protein [Gemmatimonadales bacterium]
MFEDLVHDIQSTFTERFFKIQVSADPPPPEPRARRVPPPAAATPASSGADDLFAASPRRVAAPPPVTAGVNSSLGPVGRATAEVPEVGRNDPCPCGSGKKYKKCHGVGR